MSPQGHFCQQAMECLDTVLVANLAKEDRPAPNARSEATAWGVGLTSIIAAPLNARGTLPGVMSVARSSLTDRTEPYYTPADRGLFGALASWVGAAVDNANPSGADPLTALAACIPQRGHQRAFLAVE
jgi:GAF domain-containing protein